MGSGRWLGSRTRRFTKKTLAFIVPLALLVSMMLSNAPLASAQDASPSPTADPSPTDVPTTAPTLAPSASDAPSTDAPSPTDSPSATDASPAPPPETTPTEPAAPSDTSSPAVTNYASLIVRTVPGLTDADVAAAIAAGGGTEISSVPALRLHVVEVDAATVADSIAAYSADARVESVDRDRTRDAEATPNDPAYPDQWSLPQIGWDQAYGSTTISGVSTIAVLDTGVQSSDVPTGPGWSAFGGDPGIDPNGHGTWIASIAGATTDNGQGIAGVGFDGINIMPVQVLDATGTGQDSDIIAGLVWAADHGANVAVMAFSNPGYSTALQDAVNYAWAHGVVVVAAAGNDGGTSPNYPAGDTKVVGVGATDQTDALWSGSNSSAAVFITAPGVGIKADDTIADTVSVTGTSASAAIVAGAAAQLIAADPSASPGVIVGRLARNADPDGGVGNGRVNLARALGDSSTASVVPTGAPGGGPVVGPYVAATIHATVDSPTVTDGGGLNPSHVHDQIERKRCRDHRQYSTASGATNPAVGGSSCSQGVDFINTSGSVTFTANNQTQLVDVTVCSDSLDEADETLNLNLTGDDTASGTGTITDDDATPSLNINDVSQNEGNSGTTALFSPSPCQQQAVEPSRSAMRRRTEPRTQPPAAPSGERRPTQSGSLTFSPTTTSSAGDTSKTVSILVCGDTTIEPNETFFVNLSTPTNATISDSQGLGTILNDDVANTAPVAANKSVSTNEDTALGVTFRPPMRSSVSSRSPSWLRRVMARLSRLPATCARSAPRTPTPRV